MASIADVYVEVLPVTGKIADGIKRALLDADKDVIAAARRWRKEIDKELDGAEVEVDADTTKAKKQIEKVEREKHTATIDVEVDARALAKARALIAGASGGGGGRGLGGGGSLGGAAKIFGTTQAIGLAPNLVPAIGSVVQAAGQLSGVLGLIPAAAGAAGLAIGSLKIATSGFGDAIKAIGDTEKFNAAVANLSPNAQSAARSIQGLTPELTKFRMTVQDAFFAGFGEQIGKLGNTYLPQFRTTMSQMAASANKALTGVSEMFQTPEMQADVKTFTTNAASGFDILSGALQPVVRAFSDIAVVGSDFLPGLATTVKDLATRFSEFIRDARESGKLHDWIQGGITAFGQLKDIVVNIGTTLGGIFRAADTGGQGFLTTIQQWTQKLSDFVNSDVGQQKLRTLFTDARLELEKWKPVLEDLPGIATNAFQGMKSATDTWFPVIRDITQMLRDHPGLVQAAATAYVAWQAIPGVGVLSNSLGIINTLLKVTLPAAAVTGAASIGTSLAGTATAATTAASNISAAFAALGTIVIPVTFSVIGGNVIANWIQDQINQATGGDTPHRGPGWAPSRGFTAPGRIWDMIVGNTDPNTGKPYEKPYRRLPGQNPGNPPADKRPGDIVDKNTPGAVPITGTNQWGIPGIDPKGQEYVMPVPAAPSVPSGGREPDQGNVNAIVPATPPPAPPPVSTYPGAPAPAVPAGPSPTPPGSTGGPMGTTPTQSEVEKIANAFGLHITSGYRPGGDSLHATGMAADYSGSRENMLAFAQYMAQNYGIYLKELIFDDPAFDTTIKEGKVVGPFGAYYTTAQAGEHKSHVHVAAASLPTSGPTPTMGSYSGTSWTPGTVTASSSKSEIATYLYRLARSKGYTDEEATAVVAYALGESGLNPRSSGGVQGGEEVVGLFQEKSAFSGGLSREQRMDPMKNAEAYFNRLAEHPTGDIYDRLLATSSGGPMYTGGRPAMDKLVAQVNQLIDKTPTGYPGSGRNNPAYTEPATPDTGGKQLAQDIVSGFAEIFGFGEFFKSPLDFGLFKIFKALMGVKVNDQQNDYGSGGGGGGGSLLDWALGMVPGVGEKKTTAAEDLANLVPGSGGGSGGLTDFVSQFIPQGSQGNVDNSNQGNFHLSLGDTKADTADVMDVVDNYYLSSQRSNLRNMPK